jgi:hypothetical protein
MAGNEKEKLNFAQFLLLLLAYKDSNLDKQDQNLSYYHYTIGQSYKWSAKIREQGIYPKSKFQLFTVHTH